MKTRWWFRQRRRSEQRDSDAAGVAHREAQDAVTDAQEAVSRLGLVQRDAEAVHKLLHDRVTAGAFDEMLVKRAMPRRRLSNGEVC